MRVHLKRDALSEAVSWVSRAVPARPTVPVLSSIRIEADAQHQALTLASFDYEVSHRVTANVEEIQQAGGVLVSGRLLADIARSLPTQVVSMCSEGSKLAVACGATRYSLPTMPVEEYPELPSIPDPIGEVDGDAFVAAVAQVSAAASRDETVPTLTGVRTEIEGERITLMATDRYRLALRELTWRPVDPTVSARLLIRARTLADIARSIDAVSGVGLALGGPSGHLVGFTSGGRSATSRLMDAEYPKVRALFPAELSSYVVLSTASMVEAVRRVALVADRGVPVRLHLEDGRLALEAGQGEDSQASEEVEATLVGEPLSIAFNPQYLLEGLNALTTRHLRMSFTIPTKPAVISCQPTEDGDDDPTFRYLLMPIRVGG